MHLFWVGAAADRVAAGDEPAAWILRAVADGAIIAAGHSEPGNDLGLWGSISKAEPLDDGGYALYGRKLFSSLAESVADLDVVEAHLDLVARQWTDRQVADIAWNGQGSVGGVVCPSRPDPGIAPE